MLKGDKIIKSPLKKMMKYISTVFEVIRKVTRKSEGEAAETEVDLETSAKREGKWAPARVSSFLTPHPHVAFLLLTKMKAGSGNDIPLPF